MRFSFTEEQEAFRQMIRQFARKELSPGYKERGKHEEFPREQVERMAEVGIWAVGLPEKYGGQPADRVMMGIAMEELAKCDVYAAGILLGSRVAGQLLSRAAEEIQDRWFPGLVRGEYMGYTGLTEPQCGSDLAAVETKAVKDGKGNYVINGEKTSITFVTFSKFGMVFARTGPKAGAGGVSCLFVPMDLPGISTSHISDIGLKPWDRSSLFYDNVVVPESHLVGEEGKGFRIAMKQLDFPRACIALLCVGLAESSLEDAINYARQRRAFGQAIASFQGVSFKIAEHYTRVEAARLLAYRALWLGDEGADNTMEVSMAKLYSPLVAFDAIRDCLLIHGHVGYSEEYPIEQRLRDVLGFMLGDGTAEIQKLIIARYLIGAEYVS